MSTEISGRLSLVDMLEGARKAQGLSKVRAAASLGTSPTTYRQWLRGQRPDWEWVNAIIDFTGEDEVSVLVALWHHGPGPPFPEVASPLSLDLGKAAISRYDKLAGVDRPTDNRPTTREAA